MFITAEEGGIMVFLKLPRHFAAFNVSAITMKERDRNDIKE